MPGLPGNNHYKVTLEVSIVHKPQRQLLNYTKDYLQLDQVMPENELHTQ